MAEYIDRNFALDVVKRTCGDYAAAFSEIAHAPAADVVPVVRCIVCKHGIPLQHSDYVMCEIKDRMPKDGFCSYGERKE